jgi:acid phosphatase type 7
VLSAEPTSGTAPLTVQFSSAGSDDPDEGDSIRFEWDFQNDGTVDSTAASPSFTYTSAGTFTAKLTVTNAFGSTSTTRNITVDPPGGGGSSLTFTPTDDAFVRWAAPDTNSGAATSLRVYNTGDQSYLKFTVTGVTGPVSSVKLRLWVSDASNAAGKVYAVSDTTWSESTITWANRPPGPDLLATGGAAPLGTWVEFDLTGAVTGNGTYSFQLRNGSTDLVRYHSKEAANDPRLVVTFGS